MLFTCGDNQDTAIEFRKLECLRLFCRQVLLSQVASLKPFAHEAGYSHRMGGNKISVTSSATCVLSLVATDSWKSDGAQTKELLQHLLERRESAGLEEDNPFTTAWILEAVTALEDYSDDLDRAHKKLIHEKEKILRNELEDGHGGVKIHPYPESAYLTQLVVRTLRGRGKLTSEHQELVNRWAWQELAKQLALLQAKSKTADAFAVAYLLMLVSTSTPSPEDSSIQRAALKTFFDCQLPDGTWPLSRPLFHYPDFGNAHCYEYEMLTQLLGQPALQDLLLDYLPKLSLATEAVSRSVYHMDSGVQAWMSGHHPQLKDPESWATASVYHFLHSLNRLLAEAVRREVFRYLETPLSVPSVRGEKKVDFAKEFLDSRVRVGGKGKSLRTYLWTEFVEPLAKERDCIGKGRIFDKKTKRSAIFYGPPGTSKTELSKRIAEFLGWPFLAIDPSHLLRNGMEGIQAEANAIFRMLEETERVVVLFDEFDEFVRERGSSEVEPFSRLLTTAMLPKLANVRDRGTLVFIIATNNIGEFDLAIRRPGRFDLLMQIMPPTYNAKMAKESWNLRGRFEALGAMVTNEMKERIGDLTYGECEEFVSRLAKVTDRQDVAAVLDDRWKNCTLETRVSPQDRRTWRERCKEEAEQFKI